LGNVMSEASRSSYIERLTPPVSDADLLGLARLLVDAVESGAAVSFVLPLSTEQALDWWRKTTTTAHPAAVFLAARDPNAEIIGSVQLHPAWAPNQPHRAEIAKLLVHRRCRRDGLGKRLIQAAEIAALEAGFTLLTLDAKRGAAAEQLYRKMGWVYVGTIPAFAVDPDGKTPHDDVIFYKQLNPTDVLPG
jgi:GNAT superfamily N-acetyltransferase